MSLKTRRGFLAAALGTTGVALLAACQPAAPAAPTIVATTPPKPTEAPAAKPTTSPAPAASPAGSPAAAITRPSAVPSAAPAASTAASPAAAPASVQPLSPRARVNLMFTPAIFSLPLHVAMERGSFDKAGLDVGLTVQRGPLDLIYPLLARGDEDISEMGTSAALFNQSAQGFDVKVASSLGGERQGRASSVWLWVDKDKVNEIKDLKDLKGHTIEAGRRLGAGDLLCQQAVKAAGLKLGEDVTLTYRVSQLTDYVALPKQKVADVYAMPEPIGTEVGKDGVVVRWKGPVDVMPWYQAVLLGASSTAMQTKRAALAKFLEVYLATCREINGRNGQWTPELSQIAAKWGEVDPSAVTALGGLPYYDPNGQPSQESLQNLQQYYTETGQVKQTVDVKQLIDTSPLDDALARLGRA